MENVSQGIQGKERFDIGQVHEAMIKLKGAGLTVSGLQRIVTDEALCKKIVSLVIESLTQALREKHKQMMKTGNVHYGEYVSCENITAEELGKSNVPDSYLVSVIIVCEYGTGRNREITFCSNKEILIPFKQGDDEADTERIIDTVKIMTMGEIDRKAYECIVIKPSSVWMDFSQQKPISNMIFALGLTWLKNVSIKRVTFRKVPFEIQASANIPIH